MAMAGMAARRDGRNQGKERPINQQDARDTEDGEALEMDEAAFLYCCIY